MKNKKLILGAYSVAIPLVSLFIDSLFQNPFSFCAAAPDVSLGAAVLLTYPLSRENEKRSNIPVLILFAVSLLCTAADLLCGQSESRFTVFLQPLLIFAVLVFDAYLRFSHEAVRLTIPVPNNVHWYAVESQARLFHIAVPLIAVSFSSAAYFLDGFAAAFLVILSVVLLFLSYALLYKKTRSKRAYILGEKEEAALRECLERPLAPFEGDSLPDEKKDWFYNSITNYMERPNDEAQYLYPFLDPHLTKKKVAEALFSNVSYISRAINTNAQVEFRVFVNGYRIRYAVGLFRENPRYRVEQLALMSGFNSQSSFNSAFQKIMGEKPSTWMRNHHARILNTSSTPYMTK